MWILGRFNSFWIKTKTRRYFHQFFNLKIFVFFTNTNVLVYGIITLVKKKKLSKKSMTEIVDELWSKNMLNRSSWIYIYNEIYISVTLIRQIYRRVQRNGGKRVHFRSFYAFVLSSLWTKQQRYNFSQNIPNVSKNYYKNLTMGPIL